MVVDGIDEGEEKKIKREFRRREKRSLAGRFVCASGETIPPNRIDRITWIGLGHQIQTVLAFCLAYGVVTGIFHFYWHVSKPVRYLTNADQITEKGIGNMLDKQVHRYLFCMPERRPIIIPRQRCRLAMHVLALKQRKEIKKKEKLVCRGIVHVS